ncbi:MAG: vWA domain-containing protein, partial [Luteibaculum sp.]
MQTNWFGVKFLRLPLFLVILLLGLTAFAQRHHSISGDGRFLAYIQYQEKDGVTGQHVYQAEVYSVAYKTLIQSFTLRYDKNADIDSLRLSHTGKMLFVQADGDYRMYNTRLGNLTFRTDQPMRFAMANQDNFFIVSAPNFVKAFDAYTGEELTDYRTAANNEIRELIVTQDDEHIAAITDRKQILFWQVGKERARKKYFGDDLVFEQDGKGFTVARRTGTQLNIYTYELPTFKRMGKLSISKALRDDARERTMALRKSDPSQKRAIINPSVAIADQFLLSQVGNYVAVLAKSPDDEKELYVIQTLTGNVKLRELVGDMRQEIELNWYSDSLLIPQNAVSPKVYNASANKFEDDLKLKFLYQKPKGLFSRRKTWDMKNISADFKWAVVDKELSFELGGTASNQKTRLFSSKEFLGFDQNARFAFSVTPNGDTKFYTDLLGVNTAAQIDWIPFSQEQRLYPEPELGPITSPADYNFTRMRELRHISEATENDTLRLVMKSIESGSKAGVQVQIIDQNGVYYYGAGSEDFKSIWCNLMVKGSDGKVRQIDDFTVTEYSEKDSVNNAVAAVLDFSGSMGWPRADALQDGVERFIKSKREDDEISLFKYDHRVMQETDLMDKTDRLIRKLYQTDFSAFGGATALLDATNAGVFSVKKARNVARKAVIVLTDGHENSSLITKNEVLKNALENGVNIYTIGYGHEVNQGYLKSIAYNTRGGHYQIYNVED